LKMSGLLDVSNDMMSLGTVQIPSSRIGPE
jgi:hypothetical protein